MIYGIDRLTKPPSVVLPKTRVADFCEWWIKRGKKRALYRMPKGWRRPRRATSEELALAIEAAGAKIAESP